MNSGPRLGAVFPQTEIGSDPGDIVRYAQELDILGIDHLMAFDHVLGADSAAFPNLSGPYWAEHQFQEPLTLFSFLAGICKLDFVTSVLILPQRQTALVAKQATTLDVLAPARLRLGVGIGWNHVEYRALGVPFRGRAQRFEEQIELLRALWSTDILTFHGAFESVVSAGINPRPKASRIPIWIGSGLGAAPLERVARVADGWILPPLPPNEAASAIAHVRSLVAARGRDHDSFGFQARIEIGADSLTPDELVRAWQTLARAGATHIAFNTMKAGRFGPDAHLHALTEVIDVGVRQGLWDKVSGTTVRVPSLNSPHVKSSKMMTISCYEQDYKC